MPSRMDDQGVSPVIGAILMVAAAVTISAGIYVWLSDFGADDKLQKFPQIVVAEKNAKCTAGAADVLFTIEAVGGDSLRWQDYTVQVFDGATDHASVIDWGGAGAGQFPSAVFGVGDTITATETTDICTLSANEFWTLRFVAPHQENSILYEREMVIR